MNDEPTHLPDMSTRRVLFLLALGVCVAVSPLIGLMEAGPVSWAFFAVGVAMGGLFSERFSRTRVGSRTNRWWRKIGVPGRALAILAFAALVWTGYTVFDPSRVLIDSFVVGMMVTLVARILFELARRRVAGERVDRPSA